MSVVTSFDETLAKVTHLFKISGLVLDKSRITLAEKKIYLIIFIINSLNIYTEWAAVITWFINGILKGGSFTSLTYVAPCFTITGMGTLKSWYFIVYHENVNRIIKTLKTLEIKYYPDSNIKQKFVEKDLKALYSTLRALDINNWALVVSFSLMPIVSMAFVYMKTGEVDLQVPFLGEYPFNIFNPLVYPWILLKQCHAVVVVVIEIGAIDFFLYICSTYIKINFNIIYHEIETLIPDNDRTIYKYNKEFEEKIRDLVKWHVKLLRCTDDLEKFFSVPTLFNFVSSSVLICLNGFNLMTIDDQAFLISSLCFLCKSLLQIYFLCYYGDMLMASSAKLRDAVYNSKWYLADYKVGRSLFIILIRAQKSCKLTACGFSDVNIYSFSRVLSTSYSYFTLLRTAYSGQE